MWLEAYVQDKILQKISLESRHQKLPIAGKNELCSYYITTQVQKLSFIQRAKSISKEKKNHAIM